MTVPYVDLEPEYQALKTSVDARIHKVLDHGQYIMGPEVRELKERPKAYTGARHLLCDCCKSHGFAQRKTGKWIVAQIPEQSERLVQLQQAGQANGCDDFHFLDSQAIADGEPMLKAREVFCSPSTGILDSHCLM